MLTKAKLTQNKKIGVPAELIGKYPRVLLIAKLETLDYLRDHEIKPLNYFHMVIGQNLIKNQDMCDINFLSDEQFDPNFLWNASVVYGINYHAIQDLKRWGASFNFNYLPDYENKDKENTQYLNAMGPAAHFAKMASSAVFSDLPMTGVRSVKPEELVDFCREPGFPIPPNLIPRRKMLKDTLI